MAARRAAAGAKDPAGRKAAERSAAVVPVRVVGALVAAVAPARAAAALAVVKGVPVGARAVFVSVPPVAIRNRISRGSPAASGSVPSARL